MVLDIKDNSAVPMLEELFSRIEGVRVAKVKPEKSEFEKALDKSIADVKAGRVTRWNSVEEMFDKLGLR